ncbi:MAG: cytochrome c peroxidase [Polaribacter sp.]|jgi:cytochrome c peroxidase
MNQKSTKLLILLSALFFISTTIDLNDLFNYTGQTVPNYITEDNTPAGNPITDAGATLGRVLFYDKNLSVNNTIACASCHKQEFAFGDDVTVSLGWDGGSTGRHSPRLANTRFGEENNFFWDERASSLEEQSTMPIQDHIEMGFSDIDGNPDMNALIDKLEDIDYYQDLFTFVYGDFEITEEEIQDALAQFLRSIQSFDSRFDEGRADVNNNMANFPNFTTEENLGKALFLNNTTNGGANCNTCHNAPEFDIDSDSDNNSVISVAGDPSAVDVTNTRSPSLRDLFDPSGNLNGPMMHDGSFTTMMDVINLYDDIDVDPANTNLDNRLAGGPGGNGQNLNLTQTEKDNLEAFLKTLTGVEIYTGEQWSDPFDEDGNITILNSPLPVELLSFETSLRNENVLLEWKTASEINNEGFEVQHSLNAVDWEKIAFVIGVGSSNLTTDYSYMDAAPFEGDNYYRLKQMDFDGAHEFSPTRYEQVETEKVIVTAYPNPVVDYLQVEVSAGEYTATLMNGKGQQLLQKNIETKERFDFSNLESGFYLLVVENNNTQTRVVKKIVKR